ncbi:MAG: type II toxin-antitoxin system VapB family antitoxin [Lentisphaeraceae bacterium]|nr:type II toxin-antitoxin system VapB family antitoxin [Lentisphaeraceae bacterium]
MSRTNIVLNDQLVADCMNATGIKTKKSLIDFALNELLRKETQKSILQLQGQVSWDGDLAEMRSARN